MKFKRRELLKLAAFQSAVLAVPVKAQAETGFRRDGISILQGATDETHTQFSVVHMVGRDFDFKVIHPRAHNIFPDRVEVIQPEGSYYRLTRLFFSNLELLDTPYALAVLDRETQNFVDVRQFKTVDLEKPDLRFALCSCMDDGLHTPGIWQDLNIEKPDVIFFLGDSVYCDKETTIAASNANPHKLFRRFCEGRLTLEIYFSQRLTPIIATWDDHDFAQNDTGSQFPFVKESQENFLSFFMQESAYCRGLENGPGVSSAFVMGRQQFILLDDRSYRSFQGSRDPHAHWGKEQQTWFINRVRNHDGPTWLFNGSQFFPKMMFKESVSGDHPVQLETLVQELRQSGKKIIFGSGDVHFSEISKIEPEQLGYTTFELTSSSIHSNRWPGIPDIVWNHRRIRSTGNHNYLLVKARAENLGVTAAVESRSEHRGLNFSFDFSL